MKTIWLGKPAFWGGELGVTIEKAPWYCCFFKVRFEWRDLDKK